MRVHGEWTTCGTLLLSLLYVVTVFQRLANSSLLQDEPTQGGLQVHLQVPGGRTVIEYLHCFFLIGIVFLLCSGRLSD